MCKDIRIYGEQTHSLNLNNSGTLNQSNLEFAKKTLLFDLLREHANELVSHRQGYPENDISDVELKADFVIMGTEVYRKIIKLIEGLPEDRKEKAEGYLNFPKLKV